MGKSIQTRMQVFSTQPAAVYTGMTNAFSRVVSTEGAARLWRGVWSVVLGAGPAHAVYFGTYEAVKDFAGGNRAGHQVGATGESLFHNYCLVTKGLPLLLSRKSSWLLLPPQKINRFHQYDDRACGYFYYFC